MLILQHIPSLLQVSVSHFVYIFLVKYNFHFECFLYFMNNKCYFQITVTRNKIINNNKKK